MMAAQPRERQPNGECRKCGRGRMRPRGRYTLEGGKSFSAGGGVFPTPQPITVRVMACDNGEYGYMELYQEPS